MREAWKPGDPSCNDIVLVVDGQRKQLVPPPRAEGDSENASMAKLDLTTLEAVAKAPRVELEACSLKRELSPVGKRAAGAVAKEYDAMLEDLPQQPRQPPPPVPAVEPTGPVEPTPE